MITSIIFASLLLASDGVNAINQEPNKYNHKVLGGVSYVPLFEMRGSR